jgi:1,2-phenylacetyl-CoA epoxidase PaaB subunit
VIYRIFARRESEKPLTAVGSVDAGDERQASAAARSEHGEEWLEMVAIPEKEMAWAIGGSEESWTS